MTPEQIKIALTFADGSLGLMGFVTTGFTPSGAVHFEREASDANIQAECTKAFSHTGNPVVTWRRIAPEEVPQNRAYRNAWVDTGSAIVHDMVRAREIHRARLRDERAPLLSRLDIEFLRADEAGDVDRKASITAEKVRLRDVTADPRIEAARTVEELSGVNPIRG